MLREVLTGSNFEKSDMSSTHIASKKKLVSSFAMHEEFISIDNQKYYPCSI